MTAPTDLSHLRDLPDATLTRSEVRILCDEVDRLRALVVMGEQARREDAADHMANEVEVDRLRAALTEARDAIRECLGCRFMYDQCDCGDTEACGVCHMVNRLALAAEAQP